MGIVSTANIDYDYQKDKVSNDDWCIKIGDYKYSNYTIPYGECSTYDISYSQFWNTKSEILRSVAPAYDDTIRYMHYYLYQNGAGDFGNNNKSRMIFGRYHKSPDRKQYVDENSDSNDNIYSNEQNQYKCDIVTIDGRILAAAPLHLLIKTITTNESGEDEIIKDLYHNQMHKLSNYGSEESGGNFTEKGKVNDIAYDNKQYKYMDVVVLSKSGYQYVVPFLIVDVKWLHNNGKNHFAHLTDNTYGHVYENEEHEFDHMNPIEPYLRLEVNGEENNQDGNELDDDILGDINEILKNYLFDSDKIVSMRLYDKQYDETDPNWWKRMRNGMQSMSENEYSDSYNNMLHKGKVVKYE